MILLVANKSFDVKERFIKELAEIVYNVQGIFEYRERFSRKESRYIVNVASVWLTVQSLKLT